MEEYAVRVYTLVEHALRFDAEDKLWDVISSRTAMAETKDVRALINRLERASRDILEEEKITAKDIEKVLNKNGPRN